jgi:hypothetical protein
MPTSRFPNFVLAAIIVLAAMPARAHQFVLTTGYANSRAPDLGSGIDHHNPPFGAGGGYAIGIRTDIAPPQSMFWISPQFLYWNNLTGDPYQSVNTTYFQIELGGRLSVHSRRTDPTLYAGVGLGYSMAHGQTRSLVDGTTDSFDGDFPTGSVHIGAKSRATPDITLLAEGSYHFGLDHPVQRLSVGPASAWLIQIGVGFDILTGPAGE